MFTYISAFSFLCCNPLNFFLHRVNSIGSVISQLALFMPWMENFTRFLSLGHLSIIADRVNGLKEIYQFIRNQIDERAKSWVKGQPRDITDAYLDKIEGTPDIGSSFHKSRTTQKKTFLYIVYLQDFTFDFPRL